MVQHILIAPHNLHKKIRNGSLRLGGNKRLKIYGSLKCASGKRMKKENRVFFVSESEARLEGYRPCAKCMPEAYKNWKNGTL